MTQWEKIHMWTSKLLLVSIKHFKIKQLGLSCRLRRQATINMTAFCLFFEKGQSKFTLIGSTNTKTTHHLCAIIIIIIINMKKSDYREKPAAMFSVSSFVSL